MKLVKLAPTILLVGLHFPALADEYQDVISKAFPSYRILGPSEIIRLAEDDRRQEIYEQVKNHPGLVVGNFNSDKFADFAAIIRGSIRKTRPADPPSRRPAMDYYDGYLVVCLGRVQGGYECKKMQSDPMRIFVPNDSFLVKVSPREQHCTGLRKFRPPKPKIDSNLGYDPDADPGTPSVNIQIRTDAIGLFYTSGGDVIYIYQPNGMYLECDLFG